MLSTVLRRQWQPTPVLLPGKSHGWRSLVGCSPWGSLRVGHERATSLSLLCIGEGNGNPRQCSCLENPRDGGAWWAAVYGVAQSQTWLKRLSSSSSSKHCSNCFTIITFNLHNFLHAKLLQSCSTLCDPMDCSLPGSSFHGVFQARVLDWVAIAFFYNFMK